MSKSILGSLALSLSLIAPAMAADDAKPPLQFKVQDIDKSLTVGYAVRIVDLNGDGKPDILVCDANRVIWFSNPDWKLHTIIDNKAAGVTADNVCIDTYDIDGDGKLDIALGADWKPGNTKANGSLQWLQQPANIDDPWKVHKIFDSEPTLHRINFADLDGSGKKVLVVAPLKGANSTDKLGAENGVRLLAMKIPADPVKGPWEKTLITDQFHVMHNFLPVQWGLSKPQQLLVASFEGVHLLTQGAGGKSEVWKLGEGNQAKPADSRGAGEIKFGKLKDGRMMIGTVEPFHGAQAAVYVQPGPLAADKPWPRTVLDETLVGGHAVWFADLDGDGNDEIVVGWRDVVAGKPPVGVKVFRITGDGKEKEPKWEMTQIDKAGVACEDVACADLNGDGKIDIVAVGRATKNVRIFWNETPQAKK
jgi:hypothetical protein